MQVDLVVIGGGHAGIEACWAGARLGVKTLLITGNVDHIGQMSCNPSIGGPGKSQLVHELDIFGGLMARLIDQTLIHQRLLNTSRGPAVQALRAQADMRAYSGLAREVLERAENLDIIQDEAIDLHPIKDGWVVSTRTGTQINTRSVVITSGTFIRAMIFIGKSFSKPAGRYGDEPANPLGECLDRLEIGSRRLKTGTVPRISAKTIDFSKVEPLPSQDDHLTFSFFTQPRPTENRIACYLTHTTPKTREVVLEGIPQSALFGGKISGRGPRYCPSIEDKYTRFLDKEIHPVFLEPEGYHTDLVYIQGISTSLPASVQREMVNSITGLENALIVKYGYAVEYDAIDARTLRSTLEHQHHPGLYFAGQVNGTTGYEEAASQGLVAGANAALKIKGEPPLLLDRTQSVMGVMVDDLTQLEIAEPYRMFSSRCENRLVLRADNAPDRLGQMARDLNLLKEPEFVAIQEHLQEKSRERGQIKSPPEVSELSQPYSKAKFSALCDAFYAGYVALAQRKRAKLENKSLEGPITEAMVESLSGKISKEARDYLSRNQGLDLRLLASTSALKASDREAISFYLLSQPKGA